MEGQAHADMNMFVDQLNNDNNEEPKQRKKPKEKSVSFAPPAESLVTLPEEEEDVDRQAAIMRKVYSYGTEFGERLQGMKIPSKQQAAKMNLKESEMLLADIEHELGKAGALDIVRTGFVRLCEGIESFQAKSKVLPYNLQHFGESAVIAVNDFQMPDGSIQRGHMVPLLKEFSIKRADWFSQSVEVRIAVQMMGMMAECHRINTEGPKTAKAAAEKKTSKATASAAKGL